MPVSARGRHVYGGRRHGRRHGPSGHWPASAHHRRGQRILFFKKKQRAHRLSTASIRSLLSPHSRSARRRRRRRSQARRRAAVSGSPDPAAAPASGQSPRAASGPPHTGRRPCGRASRSPPASGGPLTAPGGEREPAAAAPPRQRPPATPHRAPVLRQRQRLAPARGAEIAACPAAPVGSALPHCLGWVRLTIGDDVNLGRRDVGGDSPSAPPQN